MYVSTYDTFLEVVSTLPAAPEEFSPKLGTANDINAKHLWRGLPTDLLDLPENDRGLVEQVWTAMVQSAGNVLSEVLYTAQSVYLAEAPVVRPKKWVRLDFKRDYLLGVDFVEFEPRANITAYQRNPVSSDEMELVTVRTDQLNRISTELPNPCSCDVHLDFRGNAYFSAMRGLRQFQVGVFQSETNFRPTSGVFLTLQYEEPRWVLRIVELTDDVRRVIVLGSATEVTDTFRLGWNPVSRELSYDLGGIAGVYPVPGRFRVKEIGFTSSTFEGMLSADGVDRESSIIISGVSLKQSSIPASVQYLPSLQPSLLQRESILWDQLDYWVSRRDGGAVLQFRDEDSVPDYAWAEYVGEESFTFRDDWGRMLDVPYPLVNRPNSETFRNLLIGLFYGLLHGPHVTPIYAAISAMAGVPICMGDGVVTALHDRQGTPAIVVKEKGRSRVYYYADYISVTLKPGDEVKYLQLLGDSGTVFTWGDGNPMLNIVKTTLGSEAEKFKYLLIQYPVELIDRFESREELESITVSYLKNALPLWVGIANATFLYLIQLRDHLRMEDELLLPEEVVNLFDSTNQEQEPFIYASSSPNWYGRPPERYYSEMFSDDELADTQKLMLRDTLEIESEELPFSPEFLNPLIWLDSSDTTTMFIDSEGTTPVTASGDPVGLWVNKGSLGASGNAVQTVSANRPIYRG